MRKRKLRVFLTLLLAVTLLLQTPGFSNLGWTIIAGAEGADGNSPGGDANGTEGEGIGETPPSEETVGTPTDSSKGDAGKPGPTPTPEPESGQTSTPEPEKTPEATQEPEVKETPAPGTVVSMEPVNSDAKDGTGNSIGTEAANVSKDNESGEKGKESSGNSLNTQEQKKDELEKDQKNEGDLLGDSKDADSTEELQNELIITGGKIVYTSTETQEEVEVDTNSSSGSEITDFDLEKGLKVQYCFQWSACEPNGNEDLQWEFKIPIPTWLAKDAVYEDCKLTVEDEGATKEIGVVNVVTDEEGTFAVATFYPEEGVYENGYFWLQKQMTYEDFGDGEEVTIPFAEGQTITIKKPQPTPSPAPETKYEYALSKDGRDETSQEILDGTPSSRKIRWEASLTGGSTIPENPEDQVVIEDVLRVGELVDIQKASLEDFAITKNSEPVKFEVLVDPNEDEIITVPKTEESSDKGKKAGENPGSIASEPEAAKEPSIKVLVYSENANKFKVVFTNIIGANDVYKISYTSTVDLLKEYSASEQQVDKIKVVNGVKFPGKDEITKEVDYSLKLLSKKGSHGSFTSAASYKTQFKWTITVNENYYDLKNVVVADAFPKTDAGKKQWGYTLAKDSKGPQGYAVTVTKQEKGSKKTAVDIDQMFSYDEESRKLEISLGNLEKHCYVIELVVDIDPEFFSATNAANTKFTNKAVITWGEEGEGGNSYETSADITMVKSRLLFKEGGGNYNSTTGTIPWQIDVNYNQLDLSSVSAIGNETWITVKDEIQLYNQSGKKTVHEFDEDSEVGAWLLEKGGAKGAVTVKKIAGQSDLPGSPGNTLYYMYEKSAYDTPQGEGERITGTLTFFAPVSMLKQKGLRISYKTKPMEKFLLGTEVSGRAYYNTAGLYSGLPTGESQPICTDNDSKTVSSKSPISKSGTPVGGNRIRWTITANAQGKTLHNVEVIDELRIFRAEDDIRYTVKYLPETLQVIGQGSDRTVYSGETLSEILKSWPKEEVESGPKPNEPWNSDPAKVLNFAFREEINQPYQIVFETQVQDEFFYKNHGKTWVPNWAKLTSDETVDDTYKNHPNKDSEGNISLPIVKSGTDITSSIVAKEGIYGSEEQAQNIVAWKVALNANKLTIKKPVIKDQLAAGLELQMDSVILHKIAGSEKEAVKIDPSWIAYDEITNLFIFTFPGEITDEYLLEFTTTVTAKVGTITNKVDFSGDIAGSMIGETGSSNKVENIQCYSGGGISVSKVALNVTKVDAKSFGAGSEDEENDSLLAGAKFIVFKNNTEPDETKAVTTKEDGTAVFEKLNFNTTYVLRELDAPDGYQKGDDYKLIIRKQKDVITMLVRSTGENPKDYILEVGSSGSGQGNVLSIVVKNDKKAKPTPTPTTKPTAKPTATPTVKPTATPTATPTVKPTATPTATPTAKPTATPTATPTVKPTATPTATPTVKPTATPTVKPTATPTATPTPRPNSGGSSSNSIPTPVPTPTPTPTPSIIPTPEPEVIIEDDIPLGPVSPEYVPETLTSVQTEEEVEIKEDDTPLGPGIIPEDDPEEKGSEEEIDLDEDIPLGPVAPASTLPQTGTASVWVFYAAGALLMLAGVIILMRKKHSEEK